MSKKFEEIAKYMEIKHFPSKDNGSMDKIYREIIKYL